MRFRDTIRGALLKLPPWRIFDRFIALAFFWVAHRRLPSRQSGLFNDYLFYLKTSAEMDGPLRQCVSDKDLVKNFYRGVFLEEHAPRTLVKFHDFDEFSRSDIPEVCILKPTHLSGCIFVDSGKSALSAEQIDRVKNWFHTNMYTHIGRERNYRLLRPTVICEEVITSQADIRDYKIFCYRGEPRLIQVNVNRFTEHKKRLYTVDWKPLPFRLNHIPLADVEPRPGGLDHALDLARKIADYFDFIRVDTYLIDGRVYLGELTSIPENANGRFDALEDERTFMTILTSGSGS
jgi:hypothetical protein